MRLPRSISILVDNRDSWKQPKPFYVADNKASLIWISCVTLFSGCLLRAWAASSGSAWREGKGKGRGQGQTRLWGARPAIQNQSCFQSIWYLTPVTYISHTLTVHWACGTLHYTWPLMTRMEFSLVSWLILFPQPQNRDTWYVFVE